MRKYAQTQKNISLKKPIEISVVVCTYNGAKFLRRCLDSLAIQSYPDYEVIVVNDGSIDSTAEILQEYPYQIITNTYNKGLGVARNIGIQAAKGDIIAFTDDDCLADQHWLEKLAEAYTDPSIAGVGGLIRFANRKNNLILKYIRESQPLSPLPLTHISSSNILYRFYLYLLRCINKQRLQEITLVYSIIGANMSFRKSVLEKIRMFDPTFTFGSEEEDVCKRIHQFQVGDLVYTPHAVIYHTFSPSLFIMLRRYYRYGIGCGRMYCKHEDQRPVIFPFPVLVAISTILVIFDMSFLILPLLLPLIFYGFWVIKFIQTHRLSFLLFPYLQLCSEFLGNVGFVKGWKDHMYTYRGPNC